VALLLLLASRIFVLSDRGQIRVRTVVDALAIVQARAAEHAIFLALRPAILEWRRMNGIG